MDILKEQIRKLIAQKLKREDRLLEELYSEVEREYSVLWSKGHELERIREFLIEIVRMFLEEHSNLADLSEMDRKKFREDVNILLNKPDAILQRFESAQIKKIAKTGLKKWFRQFREKWQETESIIRRYDEHAQKRWEIFAKLYYRIYDDFSEKSRDNTLKAYEIAHYADETEHLSHKIRLFEIGPGTGPIMRRLVSHNYDVIGIDVNAEMIKQLELKASYLKGKVEQADILHYEFLHRTDLVYVESGIFLFTRLKNESLIFEISQNYKWHQIFEIFRKIYNALPSYGTFLIGIQGLMENVDIGHGNRWAMEREQLQDHALRKVAFYYQDNILYEERQYKQTISFEQFKSFAIQAGFKSVEISPKKEWVVLRK